MIILPAMSGAQAASWHGVMDLHDRLAHGWTMIGGQMVHLHCAEHEYAPPRPTNDVDAVIDVRADRDILQLFTGALVELGSRPAAFPLKASSTGGSAATR
ncbi:hypothetical protein [Krasilnikovia sp. MM14-A1259]|uniref:hypothetical protein n=1 Tax=Krasilnikovia sp. MM14-A1259 TaxID=3373539 RepID=UPI00382CC5A0